MLVRVLQDVVAATVGEVPDRPAHGDGATRIAVLVRRKLGERRSGGPAGCQEQGQEDDEQGRPGGCATTRRA